MIPRRRVARLIIACGVAGLATGARAQTHGIQAGISITMQAESAPEPALRDRLELAEAQAVFAQAADDPRFHMCDASVLCADRAYLLGYELEKKSRLASEQIYINCPEEDILAVDPRTQAFFHYGDHWATVLKVRGADGRAEPYVLDPQFTVEPLPLAKYLAMAVPGRPVKHDPNALAALVGPPDVNAPCSWEIYDRHRSWTVDEHPPSVMTWDQTYLKVGRNRIANANHENCPAASPLPKLKDYQARAGERDAIVRRELAQWHREQAQALQRALAEQTIARDWRLFHSNSVVSLDGLDRFGLNTGFEPVTPHLDELTAFSHARTPSEFRRRLDLLSAARDGEREKFERAFDGPQPSGAYAFFANVVARFERFLRQPRLPDPREWFKPKPPPAPTSSLISVSDRRWLELKKSYPTPADVRRQLRKWQSISAHNRLSAIQQLDEEIAQTRAQLRQVQAQLARENANPPTAK